MTSGSRHIGGVLVLGFGLLARAASAQQPSTDALLQQFISGADYQAAMWDSARRQAAAMPDHCADVKPADARFSTGIAAPVAFEKRNDRYVPTKGAWISHLNADVCGTRRRLNILSIAKADGQVEFLPLYRGTTRADLMLQRDVTATAVAFAAATSRAGGASECKSPMIVDTRFVWIDDKPQPQTVPGRVPYAWREVWTIDYCGKPVDVAIDFTPDSTGTTFDVHSPKK